MNKQILIAGVLILVIVGGGGLFLMSQNNPQPKSEVSPSEMTEVTIENTPEIPDDVMVEGSNAAVVSPQAMMSQGNEKEFAVDGMNFSFSVKEMKVKKGYTVQVTFTNKDGMHDWRLDEFSAQTKVLQTGQSETVEFVADKAGTFEYYCSVGQHRQNGMVGKLIVE